MDVETAAEADGLSIAVVIVNRSEEKRGTDVNLYEVELRVGVGELGAFTLDALPDSFRYDRHVLAYGINGGVEYDGDVLSSTDVIDQDRRRPQYWDETIGGPLPDLRFATLAADPLPSLSELVEAMRTVG